jgi:hypothetical protein
MRTAQPDSDPEIPDLLHLAKVYQDGFGTLWNDKSEATRILAITYRDLRRSHLTAATSLLNYPAEILVLFEAVGFGTSAVRSLNSARKRHGIAAIKEKAVRIKASGKDYSRAKLVSLLTLEVGLSAQLSSMHQQFDPKELSEKYQQGLKEGRWLSLRGANAALGSDKSFIAVACGFMDLPWPVTNLFEGKTCTYDICREILEIEKAYGRKMLLERARLISAAAREQLSATDIVRLLAGFVHQSATVIPRIRVPHHKRKLVVEFHCDDSRFLLDRSNELMKIVETGMASLIEAALASLGASPVLYEK